MGDERLDILADSVDTMACTQCGTVIDVRDFEPFSAVACPDCATALTVPAQFGQFLLVSVLGKGGMGAVYKGLDQSLNRHVAIKVMRQEFGEDSQFLKSFLQEAQAAAALNHRNVAQIYSFGQEHGQPYIIMELVEGGRLDEWIEQGKTIDESLLIDIGIHISQGLSAAHEAGLVHGDIKPANILFNRKGVSKLADFGLASFVKKQQEQPGEIWGTPYYIPPEKIRRKPADHRADIYSLGGTLYHALVGRPPFDGATAKEVVMARLGNPPPDPRDVRKELTEATAHVLRRMMAEKPGRRYPTYPSLLADLKKAHRAALKREEEDRQRAEEAEQEEPSSKGKWIGIISLLILLLGGGGAWWWMTQRDTGPERVIVRHRLDSATGKMVSVYADEVEDPAVVAAREQQVRDTHTREILDEAVGLIVAGQTAAAQEKLTGRADWLLDTDPTRYPLRLAQGIAAWTAGTPDQGMASLKEITAAPAAAEGAAPSGPGAAVRTLAGFLSHSINLQTLEKEAEGWTAGEQSVADLAIGLKAFQNRQFKDAQKRFSAMSETANDSADWTQPFGKISKNLLAQLDDWDALQSKLTDEDPQQSLRTLKSFRDTHRFQFDAPVNDLINTYQAILKTNEQEAGAEVIKQQAEIEARDIARVDKVRKSTIALIKKRDFDAALAAINAAKSEMKTDAGRDAHAVEVKRMKRLISLHDFIITGINKAPLSKPLPEIGGRLTRADGKGIHAAVVDGGGSVTWDKVSAGLYLNLFNYYIKKPGISEAKQADLKISMALYCHRNKAMKPAKRYVDAALKLSADAAKTVAEILPDLAPEPEEEAAE